MQVLTHRRPTPPPATTTPQLSGRRAGHARPRGFTLIELMITLAVAVILLVIAVPSFRTMTISNRLTTTANDVVGALNIARMEAIKRNASVQFCSNNASLNTSDPLGTACGTAAGAVETLVGSPAVASSVGAATIGIVTPLQLSGDMAAVRFGSQGLGYLPNTTTVFTGTVANICSSAISSNNHRVVTLTAGSIVQTTSSTGTCP